MRDGLEKLVIWAEISVTGVGEVPPLHENVQNAPKCVKK